MRQVRAGAVLFVLWAFQVSVFAHLRPFGVSPDLLLVAALVGGLIAGSDFGARHGFVAGLLLDLVTAGPLGLAAGIYGFVAHGIGGFARTVDSDDPRVLPILIGVSAFLATSAYGLGLGVLGSEQFVNGRLLRVGFLVSVYSVVLAIPVRTLVGWALSDRRAGARGEATQGVVN